MLTNELGERSYKLLSLQDVFVARVASCEFLLHKSYELLFVAPVTSWFVPMSYELLFTYELRAVIDCTSYELLFNDELQQKTVYCRSSFLKSFCCIYHLPVLHMKKNKT